MKSTGIVRRIDDLGRVVIPKEIRRTMRIREGDPLEIYTDNSGNIIFKKYSVIEEISLFANVYADVLSHALEMPVLISDCDHIVSVSGIPKREFIERRITSSLEDLMKYRINFSAYENPHERFIPVEGLENEAVFACPIISSGDIAGSICVLKNKNFDIGKDEKEVKYKLAEITAKFLGKHLED